MKTALVTLCIPVDRRNIAWMEAGLPSKKAYAANIGADFINITEPKLGISVAGEKYQVGEVLDTYDRILYIDADTFIAPDAPNIFEHVPEHCFGAFNEGRPALYNWLKEGWPDDPCEFYVNNGLFVCSREHKWLFDWKTLNTALNTYEQTCMSRRIWEALRASPSPSWDSKINVIWLSKSWNYMPRTWIGGPQPGWVPEPPPSPIFVWHYPCHRPEERLTEIQFHNKRYGL